ncbi:redox-sensitive transcriptional activator SoxR [Corynebacterium epidermidicanis]|uniref:Redox-sensitive transcriptional activator SoxR n=1 Tax=Corynebacterium epidermidicanis TaxID=1050174 RepID=A0A0G3GUB0_9CORY|nr:redox-sensitive transcriptional activator SoxR [Corynebacterium epidermidicanis]AKK03108.1 redox-sensitive transcriptional activator SoxR [Corynebacterium epidermidicanis]
MELSVGEVAQRAGVNPSAIRFYEAKGLITSHRNSGNQRRFDRSVLRRVSFILVAQRVGLSLGEIAAALETLPHGEAAPTKADWQRLSEAWRPRLELQIEILRRLKDNLDGCIGCGCLSLDSCALYNPDDELAELGSGAVKLDPLKDD